MFTRAAVAATEAAKQAELDAHLDQVTGFLGLTIIAFGGLVILDVAFEIWKILKRPKDWR